MTHKTWKRYLSLLLTLVLVLALLPAVELSAWAANVNTGVTGLTADSSGSATWTPSNGTITGSVKANKTSGCTGDSYTAQTGTLTFTNNSGSTALVSFDYSLTLNGGSVTVDGSAVTAGGSFNKKLDAGATVAVAITSNASNENSTTISMSNLKLTEERNVDVTFKAPTNGSYTVDGAAITADTVKTVKTTDSVALAATPASGYKFFGWHNETTGGYLSTKASFTTSFTESATVVPKFVAKTVPVWQVGTSLFTDLNEAIAYATSSGTAKITLISDGTLPAGNYTIPNGKTLLIPFDEAQTVYTTSPEVGYVSHTNPSAFRKLTMASGAKITVNNGGAISVPSKLCATGTGSGSWNGTPTGKYGHIAMNTGSSITINSGGKLYCYGYISGSGTITANSGSEVWECFQIRSWRGGTATSGMADNSQKVFPINQYYIQNIEVPLKLEAGATEKVYTAVNMSNQAFVASATFIGSGGMFNPASGGSITKSFTGATDRLVFDIEGNASVSSMALKITGLPLIGTLDLNTASYVLPMNSNITINVKSGTTTVSQDLALFPGAIVTIAEGATMKVNSKGYVYDKEQWGNYAIAGGQLCVVGYSTVNGTTAKRTAASLVDAKIDVNGTLNIAGELYTTESGADIISSGKTGQVKFATLGTEENTYQATQSGSDITYVSIPITSAQLHNADGSYTATAGAVANDVFTYCPEHNKWEKSPVKVTFDANGGSGTMSPQTFTRATATPLTANAFTNTGHTFTGWNTKADGSGTAYGDGKPVVLHETDDLTLYAQWSMQQFNVSFNMQGHGTQVNSQSIEYNGHINSDGLYAVDEIISENGNRYQFGGWYQNTAFETPFDITTPITADTVLYAKWTQVFTVTWKTQDGSSALYTQASVAAGSTPAYPGADNPAKDDTAQYHYSFAGWASSANQEKGLDLSQYPVSADATYYAAFKKELQTYTVTFDNQGYGTLIGGDNSIYPSQNVAYGGKITKPTLQDNVNEANNIFRGWYTDAGCTSAWDFENGTITKNITLYAKWEQSNCVIFLPGYETEERMPIQPMTVTNSTLQTLNPCTYTRQDGYTFHHWVSSKGSVYQDKEPIIFTDAVLSTAYTLTLTAVWAPPADGNSEVLTVSWKDAFNGQNAEPIYYRTPDGKTVAAVDYYNSISELHQPTVPSHLGYYFTGWSIYFELDGEMKRADVVDNPNKSAVTITDSTLQGIITTLKTTMAEYENVKVIELRAEYEKLAAENNSASVTIQYKLVGGGELTLSDENLAEAAATAVIGSNYRATAKTPISEDATYYFDHWEYNGQSASSTELVIRPSSTNNINLVAWYSTTDPSSGGPSDNKVELYVTEYYAETVNGVPKVAITLAYNVLPDAQSAGYTVKSVGFYCAKDEAAVNDCTSGKSAKTPSNNISGTYTLHISSKTDITANIYAKPYVILEDKDGNELPPITGETMTLNWTQLNGSSGN